MSGESGFHVPDDVSESPSDRSEASSCQLLKSRPRTFSVPSSGDEAEGTDDEGSVVGRSQRPYRAGQQTRTGSQGDSARDPIELEDATISKVDRIIDDSEDEEPVPAHSTTPTNATAVTLEPVNEVPDSYAMPAQYPDQPQEILGEHKERDSSPSPDLSDDEEPEIRQREDTCSDSDSMRDIEPDRQRDLDRSCYDEGPEVKTGSGTSNSLHLPPAPSGYHPCYYEYQQYAQPEAHIQEPNPWTQDTPSIDATHNHHVWSDEPTGTGSTYVDHLYGTSNDHQTPTQARCKRPFTIADAIERDDRLEMTTARTTPAQPLFRQDYSSEESYKRVSPELFSIRNMKGNSALQKASGLVATDHWQADTEALASVQLSAIRPPSPSDAALARKATLAGSQHPKFMDAEDHIDELSAPQSLWGPRGGVGSRQASSPEPFVSLPTSQYLKERATCQDSYEHQRNPFLPPYDPQAFDDWHVGTGAPVITQPSEHSDYPQGPFSRRHQSWSTRVTRSPSYEPPSPEKSCLVRLKLDQQNIKGRVDRSVDPFQLSKKVDISNLVNSQAEASRGLKRKVEDISTDDSIDASVSQTNMAQAGIQDDLLPDAQPRDLAPIPESLSTQGSVDSVLQSSGNTISQGCQDEPARKRSKISKPKVGTVGKVISGVCLGLAGAFAALVAATPGDVWEEALREAANV
ncbi:MAG: hypothetical protein Q9222_005489 [Ikaeria aurantiellina]